MSATPIFIDVRSESEYAEKHHPKAINIPLGTIPNSPLLPKDKNATIYVYCRSGMRSSSAQSQLKGIGYTNVTNLGGLDAALKY